MGLLLEGVRVFFILWGFAGLFALFYLCFRLLFVRLVGHVIRDPLHDFLFIEFIGFVIFAIFLKIILFFIMLIFLWEFYCMN